MQYFMCSEYRGYFADIKDLQTSINSKQMQIMDCIKAGRHDVVLIGVEWNHFILRIQLKIVRSSKTVTFLQWTLDLLMRNVVVNKWQTIACLGTLWETHVHRYMSELTAIDEEKSRAGALDG
eukprot:247231_1